MGEGNLLNVNVMLLKMWSIYPRKRNSNIFIMLADWLYKFVSVLSLYVVVIPCAYDWYLGKKDKITDYTLNIMNTGAYFCSIFTLHFFHIYGRTGRDLVEEMNLHFKYKADGEMSDVSMVGMDKLTRKITIGFFSLLNSGVIMMALVPLLMKEKLLPIPGEYPFPWKENPYYQLLYIIHVYAQIIIGSVTSSSDAFFMCMVLIAAEEFKILASNFHNCIYNVLTDFGVHKDTLMNFHESFKYTDDDILKRPLHENKIAQSSGRGSVADRNFLQIKEIMDTKDFEQKCLKLLILYIKHHQMLLNFCKKMENFFWPLILMKVGISMFYHIFITFAMVTSTDTSMALTLAQYEICAVAEILIFAIAGQALIDESENTLYELFSSPWYLCSKDYKVAVRIVLMRCTRNTRVSVGKLRDMSLPTFIVIMKTALSYFAVLRQVTE